ncbi:MAG: branched-chain amino acid aminotransferase, partial [Alphaproteobacteria bacterium]|nr:branched-chain amino acid aminotransferase [Alphaproteobacteria bacterium]
QEVRRQNKDAWAILLDHHGNLSEGVGSNLFLVAEGALLTPQDLYVLCGISRETVIELAGAAGIPVIKKDLDLYDAYTADEAFITSTSFCACPVRSIGGRTLGAGSVPGPVTRRLMQDYAKLVDCDYVAQYLRHLPRA